MNVRRKLFNPDPEVAIKLKSHKHDFSKECIEELEHFAKLHKYDDRKQFKEAWNKWTQCNYELINHEKQRIASYDGNVVQKMFFSVRYYFRKKADNNESKKRRKYVSLERVFLATIDKYLYNLIQVNIDSKSKVSNTSPSNAFDLFCEQHLHTIEQIDCSVDKLKKTFKNRYYMMKRDLLQVA